jgi:hypothetical protein
MGLTASMGLNNKHFDDRAAECSANAQHPPSEYHSGMHAGEGTPLMKLA